MATTKWFRSHSHSLRMRILEVGTGSLNVSRITWLAHVPMVGRQGACRPVAGRQALWKTPAQHFDVFGRANFAKNTLSPGHWATGVLSPSGRATGPLSPSEE